MLQVLQLQGRTVPGLVAELTACRELVWRCCVAAVELDPTAARDVPGADHLARAHHAMARTATSLAQAAQALVIAPDDPAAAMRAVRAAAGLADEAAAALSVER